MRCRSRDGIRNYSNYFIDKKEINLRNQRIEDDGMDVRANTCAVPETSSCPRIECPRTIELFAVDHRST
jgi:hypothetical protein